MPSQKIVDLLGDQSSYLLDHQSAAINKAALTLPSPKHVDEIWINSNRNNQVLRSMQALLSPSWYHHVTAAVLSAHTN